MAPKSACPEPSQLVGLLGDSLGEGDRQTLTDHLGRCEHCQQALELAAEGGRSLFQTARAAHPVLPPADSAYWAALRRVEQSVLATPLGVTQAVTPPVGIEATNDLALDFLAPSENPEFLGRLGHFSVVGVIGRGGMGIVLRALDRCLQRYVAVKVLAPELASNETARQRFCREARAAAAVTHENVVAIHQVSEDETSGLPYLVMQLVNGSSLEEHLAENGAMSVADILRLGAQAAAGLAAAHAQGLIHRDIKPANILLESDLQRVKITDFGLARAAEDMRLTQTGLVPGTPLYMAPEQARGEPTDHRADLFSFGSVLYAMATGRPPFQGSTPYVVLKSVTEEPPQPIALINPAIPGWLIEVIDRLQAKKPEDRFQSAAEVAEILSRHLVLLQHSGNSTPVCVKSYASRVVQAARRRASIAWFTVGALMGALGTTAILLPQHSSIPALVREDDNSPPRVKLNANVGPIWSSAYSSDGSTLATALDDGTIKIWNTADGSVRFTLEAHQGPVWSVAFSHDGRLMASASDDGNVRIWDVATRKMLHSLGHPTAVRTAVFTPDGKGVVTGARNGVLRIWDTKSGETTFEVKAHEGVVMGVAFSPEGKTVASAGSDKLVKLWDVESAQVRFSLTGHTASVYSVAFAPDGKHLVTGSWDRTVRVWDTGAGNAVAKLDGNTLDVWSVAFSPNGRLIASGGEDRSVRLWDLQTTQVVAVHRGLPSTVYSVIFTPDGRSLAASGREGVVRIWDVEAR